MARSATLQDFTPVLLETSDPTLSRHALGWLLPEFRAPEAEDEFALFYQFHRYSTFAVVIGCFVLFCPVTAARWSTEARCRSAACILGLCAMFLWLVCVCLLAYLLREHKKFSRLFALHKNHLKSVGSRALHETSPEAFASATLDKVLPTALPSNSGGGGGGGGGRNTNENSTVAGNESVANTSMLGVGSMHAARRDSDFRVSFNEALDGSQAPPSIVQSTAVAMDERHKYLAQARNEMRTHATLHEVACGCVLSGFLFQALAFLAERGDCALGVDDSLSPMQRLTCEHSVQLEASFLYAAVLTSCGLVPLRMTLITSVFGVSTIFLLASWWYLRPSVSEGITSASHSIFAVACGATVLVSIVLSLRRERRMRDAFSKLCDIQTSIAQLANVRHHTGGLVGPAIPPGIAKVVAARQELFDYSGDAAVLFVGIRDLSLVASDASCSEITDFLQRWFLVLDSIKLCFPRCFKLHCFGDRYMVVAGWEQYLQDDEKEKMNAAMMAEMAQQKQKQKRSGTQQDPSQSIVLEQQSTILVEPSSVQQAPILVVQTPSSEFIPEQPASNPALKARWNAECVYSFGILVARILQPDFFERLWCTVRGVYWSPGATPRFKDSELVSVAIAADIGRAAGVLLAGTTLSYVAVGDAVSRCQRLVNTASESGFFVSHEFQKSLGFAVDPYMCTVLPEDANTKSALERELESLGVSMWNAPVLQSIGESIDVGDDGGAAQHGGAASSSAAGASPGKRPPRTSPEDGHLASSGHNNNLSNNHSTPPGKSKSTRRLTSPNEEGMVSPPPATASIVQNPLLPQINSASSSNPHTSSGATLRTNSSRSTSHQILEMIQKELQVNSFTIEKNALMGHRFSTQEAESQYVSWVESGTTARRREEFLIWFLLCVVSSVVYLASTLMYGDALLPIPSTPSLFVLSALIALLGTVVTLVWYPTLLVDGTLYAVGAVHHVVCVAGFFNDVAHDEDGGMNASSSRAALLWLLTHVIITRLPAPRTAYPWVELALDVGWCIPFLALSSLAYGLDDDPMPTSYVVSHLIAEVAVLVFLVMGRSQAEEERRNAFASRMRLRELDASFQKDATDIRNLLERLVHSKDLVDELLPGFLQRRRGSKGDNRRLSSARETALGVSGNLTASVVQPRGGGSLIGSPRETAFLVCTMAFNGSTPMPKRSSRRVQAMHQMKPILKPMWKFFGQLEDLLKSPQCTGATVVKTNGDMILITPKVDRTTAVDELYSTVTTGANSMLECAIALSHLGFHVPGVEMRLVLSFGPLAGAILGSCALSLEYYGPAMFVAYELTQRALPRLIATEAFLRCAPKILEDRCTIGPAQNERILQYGFIRIVPLQLKQQGPNSAQQTALEASRRSNASTRIELR